MSEPVSARDPDAYFHGVPVYFDRVVIPRRFGTGSHDLPGYGPDNTDTSDANS